MPALRPKLFFRAWISHLCEASLPSQPAPPDRQRTGLHLSRQPTTRIVDRRGRSLERRTLSCLACFLFIAAQAPRADIHDPIALDTIFAACTGSAHGRGPMLEPGERDALPLHAGRLHRGPFDSDCRCRAPTLAIPVGRLCVLAAFSDRPPDRTSSMGSSAGN